MELRSLEEVEVNQVVLMLTSTPVKESAASTTITTPTRGRTSQFASDALTAGAKATPTLERSFSVNYH
jgi:hypothetical protein